MKYVVKILALFFVLTATASAVQMPNLKSKEKLICEVVLCTPIGLAIPASRSKCTKVIFEWSKYVATLGFLEKPPKCPIFNAQGQKVGSATKAKQVCNHSENPEVCREAIDDEEFDLTSPSVCELLPERTVSEKRAKKECFENLGNYQSRKG